MLLAPTASTSTIGNDRFHNNTTLYKQPYRQIPHFIPPPRHPPAVKLKLRHHHQLHVEQEEREEQEGKEPERGRAGRLIRVDLDKRSARLTLSGRPSTAQICHENSRHDLGEGRKEGRIGGGGGGGGRGRTRRDISAESESQSSRSRSSHSGDDTSIMSLPSLLSCSFSKPLFEDSDEEDIEARTPSSWNADSASSLSPRNPSPFRRRKSLLTPTLTTLDPLISPPPDSPTVFFQPTTPSDSISLSTSPPSASSSSSTSTTSTIFSRTTLEKTAKLFTESLLTKSILSISHKLPNLSLTTSNLLPRLPLSFDLSDSGIKRDWEWKGHRAGTTMRGVEIYNREGMTAQAKQLASVDDCEASSTFVQLQTFSPPPSPKRSASTNNRSLSPSRSTITPSSSSSSPSSRIDSTPFILPIPLDSSTTPTINEPFPRFVSNQRHLLILALEFSMISASKITCPLRQRSYVVRMDGKAPPAAGAGINSGGSTRGTRESVESKLRWEI